MRIYNAKLLTMLKMNYLTTIGLLRQGFSLNVGKKPNKKNGTY
ncbi:hypothetical protein Bmyc01_59090 [Bacillus mycoides]|nr:hypothetical protein Bmyc01_59090 [Bacillus mycoides]